MRNKMIQAIAVTSALSMVPSVLWAADDHTQDISGLLNLSLQQLSDVEITSVSKRAEKSSQAAAAIYVITQEDIRRSGMQSVPELLRMVPGLQVAQSGSQNWAISSRGSNGQFANRLLVLIDGRTVYTPIFSGVWWDVQNLLLEDIERIEVIRGPGATLWGANAVNGVINIISKSAKDTQGTLLTVATGNHERVSTAARYGGSVSDLAYRTYAQYFDKAQEHTVENSIAGVAKGNGAQDSWSNGQGGFRFDWTPSEKEQKTLQGDFYKGKENAMRFLPTVAAPYLNVVKDTDEVSGMNVLGRFQHEINPGSDITFQAYYDDVLRQSEYIGYSFHTQTFDMDFQHNLKLNSFNDITWGLGYRRIDSGFGNSFYVSFNPENYYENLFSGFLQDKVTLIPNKLSLTFGTKLEHNDFSGFEWEPSVRIAWIPTPNQTVWSAVSRAVRTPVQADQNLNLVLAALPTSPTTIIAQQGSQYATADVVTAYEVGYRIQPRDNVSIDVTGFINKYRRVDSFSDGTPYLANDPVAGPYAVAPELSTNNDIAETRGIEATTSWEVAKNIKLSAGYTLYYEKISTVGTVLSPVEGTAPKQQFNIHSYVDLPYNIQWDTMAYYVNHLNSLSDGFGGTTRIPAYLRLDMRFGWTPIKGLDLSLIGQNLLQSEHAEFAPTLYQTQEEIGRSVLAKATLRF